MRNAPDCVGDKLESFAKCSGINYSIQLYDGSVEVRPRFHDKSRNLAMSEIESVELLRKSVMPPSLIGLVVMAVYAVLALPDGWLTGILPFGIATPLQSVSLGIAVVCLVVLVVRWFFTNLVLKPSNTSSITLRMVPANGARRFVALFQTQVRLPHEA